jgi:hypothetical protein
MPNKKNRNDIPEGNRMSRKTKTKTKKKPYVARSTQPDRAILPPENNRPSVKDMG